MNLVLHRLLSISRTTGSFKNRVKSLESRSSGLISDNIFYAGQRENYTQADFVKAQNRVLNNLQNEKSKREFSQALKLAEQSIIYQENPTVVL